MEFTLQLMEKAARLQVLSPVKRVVFPLKDKNYNDLITLFALREKHLTESVYIW